VPSYVVSRICQTSLADSHEILANSDDENAWHKAWRALSLESHVLVWAIVISYAASSSLIQSVSAISQTSIDLKKKHMWAFQ